MSLLLLANHFPRAVVTAATSTSSSGIAAVAIARLSSRANDDKYLNDKSLGVYSRQESKYALGKHRSNALEMIQKVPIIEVDGDMAVCDGGGGPLGHPLEYIKLRNIPGDYAECIYCGLRYKKKET